jgi:hypothetical protein
MASVHFIKALFIKALGAKDVASSRIRQAA